MCWALLCLHRLSFFGNKLMSDKMQKPQTSEKGAYRVGYSHLACNLHLKKVYENVKRNWKISIYSLYLGYI